MSRTDDDRFGFPGNYFSTALRGLVPQAVARRAISVRVRTDERRYRAGESVEIDIEFRNRLPVPVSVETPKRRLWGWSVDGLLEASERPNYERASPAGFEFRAGECKRIRRTWDGRFERDGESARESAGPGEYEIAAFVATADRRPRDATTITIE